MTREIPLRSFTLNIAGRLSVIKKVGYKVNEVMTKIVKYYQDNVEITKEAYLALEYEFEKGID